MSRIIKLTENDLARIVRRVINEQEEGVENFDSIINKTVNFYKTKYERQDDYVFQGIIRSVTQENPNSIIVKIERDGVYQHVTYKCTDTSGYFNDKTPIDAIV